MSSQLLSISDEAGEEGKGGEGDAKSTQGSEEVVECAENGVTTTENDGREESDSELDGEEEVLFDTSSHEQLESSSGSGGGEKTWEERCAHHYHSNVDYRTCTSTNFWLSNRYRYVKEQLEQVKAERDVLKEQLSSNPNAPKVLNSKCLYPQQIEGK